MGLLGMVERVRLLGGTCTVQSRENEGTTVAVTISRWVGEDAVRPAASG